MVDHKWTFLRVCDCPFKRHMPESTLENRGSESILGVLPGSTAACYYLLINSDKIEVTFFF